MPFSIFLFAVVLGLVTWVVSLVWTYRFAEAMPLDAPGRRSPGWVVVSTLIPIINLYKPYLLLRRVWRHYRIGPEPVFHIWWGASAAYSVLALAFAITEGLWRADARAGLAVAAGVPYPVWLLAGRWLLFSLILVGSVAFLAVVRHVGAASQEHRADLPSGGAVAA